MTQLQVLFTPSHLTQCKSEVLDENLGSDTDLEVVNPLNQFPSLPKESGLPCFSEAKFL